MEKRINEIEFCPVPPINDTMNDAYQISKTIPFNVNSYIYFEQIYQAFKHEIDSNQEFLKDVECYYSRNLFKEILDRTKMYTTTDIQLNQIQPNDILLINSPSIFAKYHFIIAVVNEDATQVNIYQSYGSYKRLHKITLPIQDFINLMNQLLTLKTGNFIDDYQRMITIENQLYGIDIHDYIERLEDYFDERVYDPDDYEQQQIQGAQTLHISPRVFEEFENTYNNTNYITTITAYRVKPKGGKRNNKKRKTVKLRKRKFKKGSRRNKYSKKH
jgi:hypothetical protein